MMKSYYDFLLTDFISLRIDQISPVNAGSDVYRIDVMFKKNNSEKFLRVLWYELWVLKDIVEDTLHTPKSPEEKNFAEFAFKFIAKRYKENNNELPTEYGAFLWKNRTEKLVQNRQELWDYYEEATKN